MGLQTALFIEITDTNTGQKFKQKLNGPLVYYDLILSVIQSYSPQADFQTITLYYWKYNSWRMFLKDDKEDLAQNHIEFQSHQNSNQVVLQIRYHCQYFLENQQEDLIKEDLHNMNQKIAVLQKMYQELREKYIQEAIDINVFWGSPLFAEDHIARNRKGVNMFQHANGVEYQQLSNQVKYTAYVNAVTQAINTCNNKKVQLFLNPLNLDSFKKKNVFTITYIIAHVEVYQEDKKQNNKKAQFSKTVPKMSKRPANIKAPQISMKRQQKEQKQKIHQSPDLSYPPTLKKQSSYNGEQIQMIVEQSVFKKQLKKQSSSASQLPQNFPPSQINQSKSQNLKLHLKQSIVDIQLPPEEIDEQNGENSEDQTTIKGYQANQHKLRELQSKKNKASKNKSYGRKKNIQPKIYMLGERLDGGLCKITPQQFKKMFDTVKVMDLLILHTSYPDSHLSKIKEVSQIRELKQMKQLKQCAKNIILINSNPVYPEPSTIYYIKQFFIHLLQSGKIGQSYQKALNDLNTLKGVSIQLKENKCQSKTRSINHFYDEKQVQFINKMNQKWVHGSLECCCCYHPHYQHCKSKLNNRPSKYAQFHYMFHTIHCDCPRDELMIHSCQQKKQIMKKHLQVLDKYSDFKQYYFCCCTGYQLGYYLKPKHNQQIDYNPLCALHQQRDRHSLKYKYKYQKRMPNEQKFQFQVFDGHSKGNIGKNLMNAFNYLDKNSLIGNSTVIIDLLEVFTKCNDQDYNICTIIGAKRTGRKAIARYFANLILVKQVFQKFVIKNVNTDSIASIIRKELQNQLQNQNKILYIFILNQKYSNSLNISKATFGRPVSAIIISQEKIRVADSLKVHNMHPKPFQHNDCLSYVKMYKHLLPNGKKNLETLFNLAKKGAGDSKLYPCELNQFQILNLVKKTRFDDYQTFEHALERMNPKYLHYYLFLMSTIKFTTTLSNKFDFSLQPKQNNLNEFQKWLIKMQQQNQLFFKDYDPINQDRSSETSSTFRESQASISFSNKKEFQPQPDLRLYKNELINFQKIKKHYYLIYACTGTKLKPLLTPLLKMFVNYSTLIPYNKINDEKTRRQINFLRIKKTQFVDQAYEATTINNNSYISRYFKQQLQQVYKQLAVFQNKERHTEQLIYIQQFLKLHSKQLQSHQRLATRKSINQNYSKPKEREKKHLDPYHSVQQSAENEKNSSSEHHEKLQTNDIPNIYHLAAVVEAGLQFVRSIISNHFIYSKMKDTQKISFLKFTILLVNNCIILLKNKQFTKIKENFDLDSDIYQDSTASNITNKIYESTHRYTPASPRLQNIKSFDHQQLSIMPSVNRTYSGKEIVNNQRQFSLIQKSAAKSSPSEQQEQKEKKSDQFLLRELYRLSTYKGLLYMLSEMQKRCDEISNQRKWSYQIDEQKIPRMRIAIQLLGIQVRLQQLNLETQQTKIPQNSQDRHLARIHEVFTQKNYNIISLKRILREQINIHNRFPKDKQQLGIIKSHIIVALALMSSCYGKFKLVRGNFMIQQIDQFINHWNEGIGIPLDKRQSQQPDGENFQSQSVKKMHKTHSMFAFMRLISENQSVYLHIIDSFNPIKFWPQQKKKNQEVQLFTKLLRLFHLFTLRNTKNKKDFYKKLQLIEFKINQEFKKSKNVGSFSTYIHNFKNSFLNSLKKQMNKLASHLILILTAQSDANEHDIKMSISQKLQKQLQGRSKENQYFCLKKDLNIANLQRLCNGYKCNYLFIYTSPLKDDQRSICIQNNEKKEICPAQKLVQLLTKALYKTLFVCLPKKKSLAQSLIEHNKINRRILYFDFSYNNFLYADQKCKDELISFQKMIMITLVSKIMRTIIDKQFNNSTKNPIPQAISQIASAHGFKLLDNNRELIRITNPEIRKCLFLNGDGFEYTQKSQCILMLHQKDRIKSSHLSVIQKFTKRLQQKSYDKKGFYIELPFQKKQFLEILSFYFREKLSFQQIFTINLTANQPQKGGKDSNVPTVSLKAFYEKLTSQKILQHIFSNKKVILTLQFDAYDKGVEECQRVLQEIMTGLEQDYTSRKKKKFVGYQKNENKKQVPQVIFYFFDYQEKHERAQFQYLTYDN